MTITPERLAAFADGELPDDEARTIESLIAANPELARQVAAHRALRLRLAAHFDPILTAQLPDHLVAPLAQPGSKVVDFARARQQRGSRRGIARWSWLGVPALAASLVLAVMLPQSDENETILIGGRTYASGPLADALDNQLSAAQPASGQTRILLSFKDGAGTYCRGFSSEKQAGIACRDEDGWQLRKQMGGSYATGSDYRQAGNEDAALMALAQGMARGGALDAGQEQAAKARGWLQAKK